MHNIIIPQAKTWLGTNFHHQGRVKRTKNHNGGCDCLGLIMGVASELGLRSRTGLPLVKYDQSAYPELPIGNMLQDNLAEHLLDIGQDVAQVRSGDVGLFCFAKNPQHVAIFNRADELSIIHAYSVVGKVCEHRYDTKWSGRLVRIFRFIDLT